MTADRRVAFTTLGCKVNQYDSEAMAELFRKAGYDVVDFDRAADVYVINTCTVTGRGAAKSRQLIRQAVQRNPAAAVVVAGCYPQTAAGEVLAIPGVSVALGTVDRHQVVELAEEALARSESSGGREGPKPVNAVSDVMAAREFEETPIGAFSGRTRAAVKVQEGCDYRCTYCIIPYARGPVRSRPAAEVITEVRRLVEAGFKEIVLTGIHLGSYGLDRTRAGGGRAPGGGDGARPGAVLVELIRQVLTVPGLLRLRLSSLEPAHANPELIELLASEPRLCRHLHLSLQSGSPAILRRMGRHYTADEYRRTVQALRARVPLLGLSTDVMVGFPGETEEHFRESLAFVREMAFSRLHVFPYSPRPGTPAASYPDQVARTVKEYRSRRMIELGRELALNYHRRWIGQAVEVLVEGRVEEGAEEGVEGRARDSAALWQGYTDTYVRVTFRAAGDRENRVVTVQAKGFDEAGIRGELRE